MATKLERTENDEGSTMQEGTRELTITLAAEEANAVVAATTLTIGNESDGMVYETTDTPGDLGRFGRRAERIGTYAALGEALRWRKHWGPDGGTPEAITAPEGTWVDLLAQLQKFGEQTRTHETDPEDHYEYDAAARTIARAFAEAGAVAA